MFVWIVFKKICQILRTEGVSFYVRKEVTD